MLRKWKTCSLLFWFRGVFNPRSSPCPFSLTTFNSKSVSKSPRSVFDRITPRLLMVCLTYPSQGRSCGSRRSITIGWGMCVHVMSPDWPSATCPLPIWSRVALGLLGKQDHGIYIKDKKRQWLCVGYCFQYREDVYTSSQMHQVSSEIEEPPRSMHLPRRTAAARLS